MYEGTLADRIREWSIGFAVIREHKRSDGANVLDAVELLEISAVVAGANRNTRTLSVKESAPERIPVQEHLYLYHDVPHPQTRVVTPSEYADLHARLHRIGVARVPHASDDLTVAVPQSLAELAEYKRKIDEAAKTTR